MYKSFAQLSQEEQAKHLKDTGLFLKRVVDEDMSEEQIKVLSNIHCSNALYDKYDVVSLMINGREGNC